MTFCWPYITNSVHFIHVDRCSITIVWTSCWLCFRHCLIPTKCLWGMTYCVTCGWYLLFSYIMTIFMAHWAIPMITFPQVQYNFMFIHVYILCVSYVYVLCTYIVKEVCHSGELSPLMGVVLSRMYTWALQTSRKKAACSFSASLCRN